MTDMMWMAACGFLGTVAAVSSIEWYATSKRLRDLGPVQDAGLRLKEIEVQGDSILAAAKADAAGLLDQAEKESSGLVAAARTDAQSISAKAERERSRAVESLQGAQQHEQRLRATISDLIVRSRTLEAEVAVLSEDAMMIEVGIYSPRHELESSGLYKSKIREMQATRKAMVKAKTAAVCTESWSIGGSAKEGAKLVDRMLKLMLRAFNGEAGSIVAKLSLANYASSSARIGKAADAINKLGEVFHCRISDGYANAWAEELRFNYEMITKRAEEKAEQARIKEQMREEARAQKEMEKAQREAEKAERQAADELARLQREVAAATGAQRSQYERKLRDLEERLREAEGNRVRVAARARATRSGHVYIISNLGSFGDGVYKIGMTRRLDPMDRVKELGDASVPFRFDVHAIIFSEDAVALERALHDAFDGQRVNMMNRRKEFFRASLADIASEARKHHGEIEFTMLAEALEYRQSIATQRKAG